MANLENYKGLQRLDSDPSGAGGKAINDTITAAADLIETNQTDIAANAATAATNALGISGKADMVHLHSASDIYSGTLADARVAQSNVTQHQASLSVTESQVSDLGAYIEILSEDATPSLGGPLNTAGHAIIAEPFSGDDLEIAPGSGGAIILDGISLPIEPTLTIGHILTATSATAVDFAAPAVLPMQDIGVSMAQANPAGIGSLAAMPVYRNGHLTLEFSDGVTDETNFELSLPSSYSGGGLVVELFWVAKTATTGNVRWLAKFERMLSLDLDVDGFASANNQTNGTNATAGAATQSNIEFTDGSDMDSVNAGEIFRLNISRDGANAGDTMTDDAQLVGLIIREGV